MEESDLYDAVQRACVATEKALQKLHSSDYDGSTSGLNEVGLKTAFIASLPEFEGLHVHSEHTVEGGCRIDLLLICSKSKSIIILEFKYIRTGFLEDAHYVAYGETLTEKFKKLNTVATDFKQLDVMEILTKKYRDPVAKKQVAISKMIEQASEQARKYEKLLKEGGIGPVFIDKERCTNITPYVILGVSSRCILLHLPDV